jgi:dynein light intermediate chain 1
MELLEKNQGWKEPDFDTVLQYLRTVLLRRETDPISCPVAK